MDRISRNDAIKQVGIELVEKVESGNVDYTNRLTGNDFVEFSCHEPIPGDEYGANLTMYVLVPQSELDAVEQLDEINWDKHVAEAEFTIG